MRRIAMRYGNDIPTILAPFECSDAICSIGKRSFSETFFGLMHRQFGAAQVIVFRARADRSEIETLLARDHGSNAMSERLAATYVKRFSRSDPNWELLEGSSTRLIRVKGLSRGRMIGTEYWRCLFDEPSLVDKMSIIISRPKEAIYVNLYRSKAKGLFDKYDRERILAAHDMIAATVERHFDLIDRSRDCSVAMLTEAFSSPVFQEQTPLSKREAQVCARIVMGVEADEIAKELKISLHSVATYRRRAFEKLEISTHKQLFSLVLKRRGQLDS